MSEVLDGVEIKGRYFPFVRITEAMQPKVIKKITKLNWRAVIWNWWFAKKRKKYIEENPNATYKDLILEGLVYSSVYQSKREWKIIRSVAFQKNFLWKLFKIVPYELRCNVIEVRQSKEIKKKFDSYLMETTKEQNEQSDLSNNTPTESI